MKINQFKNIIKECVREVLREELKEIVQSTKPLVNESLSMNFSTDSFNVTGDEEGDEMKIDPRQIIAQRMAERFGLPGQGPGQPAIKTQGPFNKVDNPFADFLNDAAHNISPEEAWQLKNG